MISFDLDKFEDEILDWLGEKLDNPPELFLRTKLGMLLKTKLKKLGYWKNKARGKPATKKEMKERMGE